MSSVTPTSTTAALAGAVPLEKPDESAGTPLDFPGGFPATPAEDNDQVVSIKPLPAAAGGLNPFHLEPGQPVPDFHSADINKDVHLDKASFEHSDALPSAGNLTSFADNPFISSVAPDSTTTALAGAVPLVVQDSQFAAGASGEASAHPDEVREKALVEQELLTKVPEVPPTAEGVAGVGTTKTESTATSLGGLGGLGGLSAVGPGVIASAVAAKDAVVHKTTPSSPDASQGGLGGFGGQGGLGGLAAAGSTVVSSAVAAKDAVFEKATPLINKTGPTIASSASALPESIKGILPVRAQEIIADQKVQGILQSVSAAVPAEVKKSIAQAGVLPEAAGNAQAVGVKSQVEAELLKEVKPVPSISNGPSTTTTTAGVVAPSITGASLAGIESVARHVSSKDVGAPAAIEKPMLGAEKTYKPATSDLATTIAAAPTIAVPTIAVPTIAPAPLTSVDKAKNVAAPSTVEKSKNLAALSTVATSSAGTNATSSLPPVPAKAGSTDTRSVGEPGPDSPASSARKRHRISAIINKIKQKVSNNVEKGSK